MPYRFSPSSLSLLSECPRCFWLQFNKGISRPSGVFPSLPSGMDRILKIHFDSFMRRGELPPELSSLKDEIKLFNDEGLLSVWRNNFKGIQWTDQHGNVFRGAIDNLLVKDGKLVVLDFKTRGYPMKDDTSSYYQNQMDIYNFLLRKNNHRTEDYAYLLFYHPSKVNEKGDVVFNTDLVKLPTSVENAEKIFRDALHVLNGELPHAVEGCTFCKWAEESSAQRKL